MKLKGDPMRPSSTTSIVSCFGLIVPHIMLIVQGGGLIGTPIDSLRLFGYQHVGIGLGGTKLLYWRYKPIGDPTVNWLAFWWIIVFRFVLGSSHNKLTSYIPMIRNYFLHVTHKNSIQYT